MRPSNNQVKLGHHLYFFPSSAVHTMDCLIVGHGGWVPEAGYFVLPHNVTIEFDAVDGQSTRTSPFVQLGNRPARGFAEDPFLPLTERKVFGAGELCRNYIIGTYLRDWRTLNDRIELGSWRPYSYRKLRAKMDRRAELDNGETIYPTWTPNIVSVRNRSKKYMFIEDIIHLVKAHDAGIINFSFRGCRNLYQDREFSVRKVHREIL